MEKGASSRKSAALRIVYAHHYAHCNLSALNRACIINFFPSREKKLLSVFPNSYVVAMTRVIHPSDYPSIPGVCVC